MTCEEFEAQLTAFSLGELEPDDAMGARAHVARCDACAAATLRDRQLTALLRASMVEMPAAGQTAVLAAVRSETTWAPRPAPRAAAAAAAGTRVRRHRRHGPRRAGPRRSAVLCTAPVEPDRGRRETLRQGDELWQGVAERGNR